jgi:mRNA interferase MazF
MNFGDVVRVDFGVPMGSEAGFVRPAIVCTADAFLRFRPTTIFVVPLTSTRRGFPSHVEIPSDPGIGIEVTSWALVEQLRAVALARCGASLGNVGPLVARQLVDVLAMIVGLP